MPKKLRDDMKKTAAEMGVPLTVVVHAMARQFVRDRVLVLDADCPFPSHTPNAETRKAIHNIQQGKNLQKFDSVESWKKAMRTL